MNLSAKDAAERILMLHKVIDAKRNYLVTLDNALLRASKITIQISGQNGSGYVETILSFTETYPAGKVGGFTELFVARRSDITGSELRRALAELAEFERKLGFSPEETK